jgi:hypothetical protein
MACSGIEEASKRESKLAEKYLAPLGTFGQVVYSIKNVKKPSADGAKPLYMTKDMVRVTPPIKGTSVYPGDTWQLPG